MNLAGLAVALVGTPAVFAQGLYDDFTLAKQASLLVAAALILVSMALDGGRLPAPRFVLMALAAWALLVVASQVVAVDWRGSVLGVYQYRQGFLTQLAYLVLFVAALRAGAAGQGRAVALLPAGGLAAVFAYTTLQATNNDPIEWWLDTSDRAIGTIGNANELAAYAVVALAACAPILAWRSWLRLPAAGAVAAAVSFVIFESESRSGIGALVLAGLVLPAAWWLAGNPFRALRRPGIALAGGVAAGIALSVAAGGLAGSASRVEGGIAGSDAGGSTRVSLWRGTIEVIKARPLLGAGPDGLYLEFPVHRPEDLGGAYDSYDLVAQSSHNYALDAAANYGLPGLAALVVLVVICAWRSVSRTRKQRAALGGLRAEPYLWAPLVAYGALTMLNPISIAAHALFFVLLGLLAAEPVRAARQSAKPLRLAVAAVFAPVAGVLALIAVLLPLADMEANRGWEDLDGGRFESAATHYDRAAVRMPFARHYAQKHAEAWLAAAVAGGPTELNQAKRAYEELDRDFGLTAGDALGLAAAEAMLGEDDAARAHIARALELNPFGVAMEDYTRQMLQAIDGEAVLRYSQKDRWTYLASPEPAP